MKDKESFLDIEALEEMSKRVEKMPQWKKEGWAILDLRKCNKCNREGDKNFISYKSRYRILGYICQKCSDEETNKSKREELKYEN